MIRQFKYFRAVVRNGSFSKAAEKCHISRSAVSPQIQALERELGFQLLERRHRSFSLTPAGVFRRVCQPDFNHPQQLHYVEGFQGEFLFAEKE